MLGYLFWGLLFVVWIGFLFFDAKRDEDAGVSQPTVLESWSETAVSKPNGEEEEVLSYSGFLTNEKTASLDALQTLGNIREKIELLEKVFEQQATPKIANLLLQAYVLDNQFEKAKKFYNSLASDFQNALPKEMAFTIWINAFSQNSDAEYKALKALLESLHQQKIFSDLEYKYYTIVFALAEGKYEEAKSWLSALEKGEYQGFATAIRSVFKQYEDLKDVPAYYQDGLIAHQLINQGFFALAKKIVLPIVNEHPEYILPYQILANTDFSMGKRASAASYFSQLLKLDPQEKNLYLYMLGVCYYQIGKYSDAVLYLAQISDSRILLDSDRYLILSYLALGEKDRVIAWWKRLLGYTAIKESDFYSFFEEMLRKPYRRGETQERSSELRSLTETYLKACKQKLSGEHLEICHYGELGNKAQRHAITDEDEPTINRFARRTPKPEFFQLLGELALEQNESKKATTAFMKALGLASDTQEKLHLKKLILQANDLEE